MALALALCPAFVACGGGSGGGEQDSDDAGESGFDTGSDDGGDGPFVDRVGESGLRRLTRHEFDNTIRDILGDQTRPAGQLLPEDAHTPFDNDYTSQQASKPLVEGLEVLAREAAQRLVNDPARLATVLGCQNDGTQDAVCMRSFVRHFGRLALRRPLSDSEITDMVALGIDFAGRTDDFNTGVEVIVRTFLQDPEFVYRVEIGTESAEDPQVFKLGDFEVATRMSYLIWGSTPDDSLLDVAEAGLLRTTEERAAATQTMLADPRARSQVDRFHSLWLGYATLPHPPEITSAMRAETAQLIERVVFDERTPWLDLFRATETFVDATLAAHYGLPAPAQPSWVPYGDSGRQGLLSHGSFLSVAGSFSDTSPTKRGKLIREQLMCQNIPPPPPNVDADAPPGVSQSDCKWDRYAAHRESGACKACHQAMDPIGFGLENYDNAGQFRTHDEDKPHCPIAGEGELAGVGTFRGPAELANILLDNELLETCVVEQLYRFAMGHDLEPADRLFTDDLQIAFVEDEHRFDQLVLSLVSHEAFTFRREEQG